ncbi:MAG: alpha/beta fold hydrolase, partial [Proteobacteria bacterium]|nr:alpha/beta fold hydrolase [Pseudomonadota bacterium]
IAAYADDVLAFLDARALKRAIIVGHSMGGAITQMLALDHAERIAGIALVATGDVEIRARLPEKYPTAGLAVIEFPFDDWTRLAPRHGRLERFIIPRELADGAD